MINIVMQSFGELGIKINGEKEVITKQKKYKLTENKAKNDVTEELVRKYYANNGWHTCRLTPNKGVWFDHAYMYSVCLNLTKTYPELQCFVNEINKFRREREVYKQYFNGIPDFLIFKKDYSDYYFLEVKTSGTGLSNNQCNWYVKHNNPKMFLHIVFAKEGDVTFYKINTNNIYSGFSK